MHKAGFVTLCPDKLALACLINELLFIATMDEEAIREALQLSTTKRIGRPKKIGQNVLRVHTRLPTGQRAYGRIVDRSAGQVLQHEQEQQQQQQQQHLKHQPAQDNALAAARGASIPAEPQAEPVDIPDAADSPGLRADSIRSNVQSPCNYTRLAADENDVKFSCCAVSGCPRRAADGIKLTTFAAWLQQQCSPDESWPPKPVAGTRTKTVYCVPSGPKGSYELVTFKTVRFSDGIHVISWCTCMEDWRSCLAFDVDESGWSREEVLEGLGHACKHALALTVRAA